MRFLCFNLFRPFYVKLAFFTVFVFDTIQTDLGLAGVFVFLQMTLPLSKLAHPWSLALLRNKKDFETGLLISQSLSFKAYKM